MTEVDSSHILVAFMSRVTGITVIMSLYVLLYEVCSIIGRAGASPPSHATGLIFLYIYCVLRVTGSVMFLRASF